MISKLFTGQRLDETGLYFYNARYYDAVIGRFISPDTIIPSPVDLQAFNRYSYCLNNPLKYVYPTGHGPYEDLIEEGEKLQNGEEVDIGRVEAALRTLDYMHSRNPHISFSITLVLMPDPEKQPGYGFIDSRGVDITNINVTIDTSIGSENLYLHTTLDGNLMFILEARGCSIYIDSSDWEFLMAFGWTYEDMAELSVQYTSLDDLQFGGIGTQVPRFEEGMMHEVVTDSGLVDRYFYDKTLGMEKHYDSYWEYTTLNGNFATYYAR